MQDIRTLESWITRGATGRWAMLGYGHVSGVALRRRLLRLTHETGAAQYSEAFRVPLGC